MTGPVISKPGIELATLMQLRREALNRARVDTHALRRIETEEMFIDCLQSVGDWEADQRYVNNIGVRQ